MTRLETAPTEFVEGAGITFGVSQARNAQWNPDLRAAPMSNRDACR